MQAPLDIASVQTSMHRFVHVQMLTDLALAAQGFKRGSKSSTGSSPAVDWRKDSPA